MTRAPRPFELLGLVAGFGLWSLAFAALYGLHGGACESGWSPAAARAGLLALFVLFLAAHGVLGWWLWRRWRAAQGGDGALPALRFWSFLLALAAGLTTLWTGLPVALLAVC